MLFLWLLVPTKTFQQKHQDGNHNSPDQRDRRVIRRKRRFRRVLVRRFRSSKITGKRCRHRKSSKGTAVFLVFFLGPRRCCCSQSPGRFGGNRSIFSTDIFWGTMDGVGEPFTRMWPFRFKERKQFVIRNALDTHRNLSTGVLHF